MKDSEVEEVTAFVQRYCAAQSRADGEVVLEPGYFGFFQGKSSRAARKARAPIAFGETERVTAEVLRRVRELARNGEGHVWLRAYSTGDTHPMEAIRVTGSLDEAGSDELESSGSAVGDLAAALIRTNTMVLDDNRELRRLVLSHAESAGELREQFALMTFHASALEHGMGDQRMEQALQALSPLLEKLGPHVIDMVGAWVTGGGGLPAEPGPRIEAGIRRLVQLAQDVGKTVTAHPTEATQERLAPLLALVQQLAPAIGLRVETAA